MSTNSEKLKELIAERRKIDEQIREIKKQTVVFGRAKLDIAHYATSKPDEWYVAIDRVLDIDPWGAELGMKRYSIIRSTNKERCIKYIDEVISDLQGLKRAAEETK